MKSFARLSRTEYLILDLLQDENRFGLELVERSRGALKRGTVYVSSRTEALAPGAIGLPRRLYRPTAYGLKVFRVWSRAERALARLRPQEA